MKKGVGRTVVVLMVVVAMAMAMVGMGGRGVSAEECVGDLEVCQHAISNLSVKPDSKCCSSLKNAVSKDLACLCTVYKSNIFQTMNLNKTRAMELPALCSISANLSLCASATPPSSATPSAEASPSTPAAGLGSSSGAMKLGWGVKPWWALVFLSASLFGL